jgi:hypothetical protein
MTRWKPQKARGMRKEIKLILLLEIKPPTTYVRGKVVG